jgi:O-antigen/teichoic acid export membrane protein
MVSAFHQYKLLFSVMSISLILYSIGFEWVYQALEEYSYITSRSLILKIVSVVLTFLLIHSSDDYVWYGFLTIFTTSASYIFNFIHIRKYISFKKEGKYNLKQHIKPIAIFLSTYVVMTIYANFDVSMLGFISNEYEVGLYNAALKIKCILLSLSTSVTAVLVPRITFYLKEKKQDLANDLLCKSMRVSLLIAFPLSIYSLLFSKNLLIFVCGNDYIGANLALKVLMLCISPLILTNLFGNQILIPVGKEKRYSQSVFVGMFINLFLNIILIPYLGAFGATIGTLVTEIWNVFYMSSGVKEYRDYIFKKIKWVLYFIPLAIGSCLSVVVSIYIRSISVFWQLVITTICFFTPYYAILIAKKEPIISNFLTNLLRKVKK